MMINLTGKSVFVKTQEEYLSVLKIARLQGFIWAREDEIIFYCENYSGSITGAFPMSEIGKTVFLTREEAEKKLEESRN